MELIPILSLIVLMATISTFILAIGAYVLYKIRESRGRKAVAPAPQFSEAELYIPQAEAAIQTAATVVQDRRGQQNPREVRRSTPAFSQQPERTFQQAQMRFTAATAQEYQSPAPMPVKAQEYKAPSAQQEEQKQDRQGKFMKYTSEGYVPVNNNTNAKTGENLKWR